MFYLQFMVGFPSGLPGDPAAPPVEEASKRGVVCATTPSQPMVGSLVRGQTPKCETVTISCVQVLFIQQMGTCSFPFPNCESAQY